MTRQYTEISQEEFEQFLEELPLEFEEKDYDWSKERIYEAYSDDKTFTLRIYSSIDQRSGQGREKGSDAIRIVVLETETGRPVLKEKKSQRIETWKKNVRKKVESLLENFDNIEFCDECGGPMIIREGEYGKFYGCSNYPDCNNTKQI